MAIDEDIRDYLCNGETGGDSASLLLGAIELLRSSRDAGVMQARLQVQQVLSRMSER